MLVPFAITFLIELNENGCYCEIKLNQSSLNQKANRKWLGRSFKEQPCLPQTLIIANTIPFTKLGSFSIGIWCYLCC